MEQPYLYAMSDDDLNIILQIVKSEKNVPSLNRIFGPPNHVLVEELGKMVWLWNYESLKNKKFIWKFFIDNYVEICSLPPLTQEQVEELGESAQILSRVIDKINTWALPAIANNDYDMAGALLAELFIDAAWHRFAHFSNNIHQLRRISHIPIQGEQLSIYDIMQSDHRGDGECVSAADWLKTLELRLAVGKGIIHTVLNNDTDTMIELKSLLVYYILTRP